MEELPLCLICEFFKFNICQNILLQQRYKCTEIKHKEIVPEKKKDSNPKVYTMRLASEPYIGRSQLLFTNL